MAVLNKGLEYTTIKGGDKEMFLVKRDLKAVCPPTKKGLNGIISTGLRGARNFTIRVLIPIVFVLLSFVGIMWLTAGSIYKIQAAENERAINFLRRAQGDLVKKVPLVAKIAPTPTPTPTPKQPKLQPELLTKSKITAEQLNKFLSSDPKSNLKGLGYAFKAAEVETNVNAVFLTALAVHESGWGTNNVTKQKNNIMSIAAYDWSPLASAKDYKIKMQCIADGALLLKTNYLTKGGKWYNGATLQGINVKYATDKGWAKCVQTWMDKIKRYCGGVK